MAAKNSKKVIYAALIGNGLITIIKFIAATITGSSAMLSEGIHSLVDTGNQSLLLYGMKRADRPADDRHPFGYGVELYFWAFVVAILIFAVGAGVSIYEGIQKIIHPHPISNPIVNYIVLGLAFIFEATAWFIAFKEFSSRKGKYGWFEAVRKSKDPSVFTVLFEDTAAMLGLIVAFIGIFTAQMTGLAWLDGAASLMIGLILAGTAALLAYETKGLIIGEATHPEITEAIRNLIEVTPTIHALNEIRTLHRGPEDVLLAISVDFENDLPAGKVENTIWALEQAIKQQFPLIGKIFIEVQSAKHHAAGLIAEQQSETDTQAIKEKNES